MIDDIDFMLAGQLADGHEKVNEYYAYCYHHLDDLSFAKNAETLLNDHPEYVETVKQRFLKEGWEGDGTIQLIWLPPFVGAGVEDTLGIFLWHVKQRNNGTSWLLSPISLPFKSFQQQ